MSHLLPHIRRLVYMQAVFNIVVLDETERPLLVSLQQGTKMCA